MKPSRLNTAPSNDASFAAIDDHAVVLDGTLRVMMPA
jgi:hypothetical protein